MNKDTKVGLACVAVMIVMSRFTDIPALPAAFAGAGAYFLHKGSAAAKGGGRAQKLGAGNSCRA
jgi:hypothetical protein